MYFINCGGRDYEKLFGPGAFYDLEKSGSQASMAQDLRTGDICITARYADKERKMVTMASYRYTHETTQTDNRGITQRVLRGNLQRSETLPKSVAAADPRYAFMFAKTGAFKRRSVLQPK